MREIPNNVSAYRRTEIFTESSVPKGLLKDHSTKKGVWGLICVKEGELSYIVEDKESYILTPEHPGVVEPEIRHHIKPLGPASFFIQFYK